MLVNHEPLPLENDEDLDNDVDLCNDVDDHDYNDLDATLMEIGVSPVKKHGASERHRRSETKRKIMKKQNNLAAAREKLLGHNSNDEPINKVTKEKSDYFDEMVELMKNKLQVSDKRTITQILTLAPKSMSFSQVMSTFNVTEYQARKAKRLFNERGILAIPPLYKGKDLPKNVADTVVKFYQNPENSRLMPGAKDFVSIAKNQHVQKQLILSSLKELFQAFKAQYPTMQIGYSKFCALRPKWCILPGASGTHSVCVCTYHQNTKLLVEALGSKCSYKDLLAKLVCSVDNKNCMLGRCEDCPDEKVLSDYLYEIFGDFDDDDQIFFSQWTNTDRANLCKMVSDVPGFIEKLIESLQELRPHSYISKSQSRYLNTLKDQLDESSVIFLGDFAENYSFVVQDEVQSFHWNNSMCSLHPVVIYYRSRQAISHLSYTVLSDDNKHDVHFVQKVISLILEDLKRRIPTLQTVHFFTDGCAGQYKNRKTMYNLCQIKDEFNLEAIWNFFATSHGKSPCDGIGGTVKRMTARESLTRPYQNQILSADDMFNFCCANIPSIIFKFVKKDEMEQHRINHADRYREVENAIPGTRSYHQFVPLSRDKISAKRVSEDEQYECTHNFNAVLCLDEEFVVGSYAAVIYDQNWWLCIITEIDSGERDVKVKFMHPKGPSKFFLWPNRDDVCFIPFNCILKIIDVPTPNATGRNYSIQEEDVIINKFNIYLNSQ